jgi:hypothetical protein
VSDASILRELRGKRVRVHRSVSRGRFVVSHAGRVRAYVSEVVLRSVLPVVSEADWKRCSREQSKNVHAYLTGELVAFTAQVSGRGWRAITYDCLTHGPFFFDKRSGAPFTGSAEAALTRDGAVRVKGKAQAPNPSSDCGCSCGALCRCGKLQSWWTGGPPACERNPMKKINACGAVLPPSGTRLHVTRSGARLLLDLDNLQAYDASVAKEHGFCPLLVAYAYGPLEVKRSFVSPRWQWHRRLRGVHFQALARRLNTSPARLENTLELEGVAWHDAEKKQPNPKYVGQGSARGYAPDPPDERCRELRQSWDSVGPLADTVDIIEDGGGDSCEVEIAEYLSKTDHSHISEITLETRCSETMVRKAIRSLLAQHVIELAEAGYLQRLGLTDRANRRYYRLTETGEHWLCAMRIGYHATRAGDSVDEMSDDAMAAAYERSMAGEDKRRRITEVAAKAKLVKPEHPRLLPPPEVPAYHVQTPRDFGRYVEINALAPNGEWAGRIRLLKGAGDDRDFSGIQPAASVMDLVVSPALGGAEIPRVLYQAAADYAQQQLGLPLASAVHRDMSQDRFWNRQVEHGTGKRHDYRSGDYVASRFALSYPPPARLPNPRKKAPGTLYLVRATCQIPGYVTSSRTHYLTRLNDRTGQFSFTVYRDSADRFRGLDVAEVAIAWVEQKLEASTGRRYTLELQPLSGGHSVSRGCPAPYAP